MFNSEGCADFLRAENISEGLCSCLCLFKVRVYLEPIDLEALVELCRILSPWSCRFRRNNLISVY